MDARTERILVTGAQGFVGRYLVAWLARSRPSAEILGVGRSPSLHHSFTHCVNWCGRSLPAPLPGWLPVGRDRLHYAAVDLNDGPELASLLDDYRPEIVFHLASALRGDRPNATCHANIAAPIALMESLARMGGRLRLAVLASSGGVYGSASDEGKTDRLAEGMPCSPLDLYSMSKLAGEYASRAMGVHLGVPVIVARVFNVVGPGQDERHVCGRFASQIAAVLSHRADHIVVRGDLHATRDFIDVRDVARALTIIADRARPGETVNVASGCETSVEMVLQTFLRLAEEQGARPIPVEHDACSPSPLGRQCADVRKLCALGFETTYSLRRSCADLLTYYLADVAEAGASPAIGAASR